ncbi:hypothetical protein SR41_04670 [Sphingomonas melonis]|uniref:Uncharacterized protein n=1 Tax=Sphingomonas melonis TaxID=152682 RepID=A0A0D1MA95_9SPHN|nr:hypothetical protein [Sphingomonas melonis]KIU29305.1 hypothetical protein SR41_04670 [Sphingomonas melonis]
MLDAVIGTCVFIAAVSAYVFSSVEKFADREMLFIGGMFIVFALIAALTVKIRRAPVVQVWGVMGMLVFAACLLFMTGSEAITRSDWNDRRCLRIQEAMLRPTSTTRDGLAEVFSALQCRPQGKGPISPNRGINGPPPPPPSSNAPSFEAVQRRALIEEVRVDKVEAKAMPVAPAGSPPNAERNSRVREVQDETKKRPAGSRDSLSRQGQ